MALKIKTFFVALELRAESNAREEHKQPPVTHTSISAGDHSPATTVTGTNNTVNIQK